MDTQQDQTLRAQIYLMLSSLFRQVPSTELLSFLANIEVESSASEMQLAWQKVKHAADSTDGEALDDEFHALFIGVGRGEVVPFASWHRTGSLMEKPLAELRTDLSMLGFEREENVKEPEDHISALCEVMALLSTEDASHQQSFFNKHIAPWFGSLSNQIQQAENAVFYKAVAELLTAFMAQEQVRFSENTKSSKSTLKIDVKNVTEYEQSE
ncbi:TorD/DmsD family molecular chaperone [Vibrio sp. TRT 17S01]|uniref:TorD/DmsD family molecular chaperone n=1 Tax=Vibrio sp. TRT 17S01 TaxID=3418505 RepID=UPI003CF6B861